MPLIMDSLHFTSYNGGMYSHDTAPPSETSILAPLVPPGLPQYSNMGRMNPEFLDLEAIQETMDEGERPAVARGRTIRILGFSPRAGQPGTVIATQLVSKHGAIAPGVEVAFRIKMGNIPLMTSIFWAHPPGEISGHWQLQVVAPDPVELNIAGFKVPLIVQALDVANTQIIDDVCIGTFEFLSLDEPAVQPVYEEPPPIQEPRVLSRVEDNLIIEAGGSSAFSHHPAPKYAASRKRAHLSIEVPSQDDREDMEGETSSEALSPNVIRNPPSQLSQKPGEDIYPGSLKIYGNLNSMANGWSDDEDQSGRRLVEFFCTRKQGRIDVKFAPIYGDDALDTNRNVVSCIWWDEMEEFVITSVDTISLLEKLVGTRFTTEEKNRIRRNLQGFKPSTISKNQEGCESFFKLLMEFPPPRPRHIEKDVKAFPWSKLASMLEKIISKYWFITSPGGSETEEQASSQNFRVVRNPEGIPNDSPSAVGLSFPTTSPTQGFVGDTHAAHTGILPVSSYFVAAPPKSDSTSLGQGEPAGHSMHPPGPGMTPQHDLDCDLSDVPMEISEESTQRPSFPLDLPPSNGIDETTSSIAEGQALSGGMLLTAHTPHEYF